MYLEDPVAGADEAKKLGLVNTMAEGVNQAKAQAAQLAREMVLKVLRVRDYNSLGAGIRDDTFSKQLMNHNAVSRMCMRDVGQSAREVIFLSKALAHQVKATESKKSPGGNVGGRKKRGRKTKKSRSSKFKGLDDATIAGLVRRGVTSAVQEIESPALSV